MKIFRIILILTLILLGSVGYVKSMSIIFQNDTLTGFLWFHLIGQSIMYAVILFAGFLAIKDLQKN